MPLSILYYLDVYDLHIGKVSYGLFTWVTFVSETISDKDTRQSLESTCLGHLGQHDTDRIVSISCCATQGGQAKYCFVSLLLVLSRILRQWKHGFSKTIGDNNTQQSCNSHMTITWQSLLYLPWPLAQLFPAAWARCYNRSFVRNLWVFVII